MSKKCNQCGAELENNALFCDECGAQQVTPESTASSAERQTSKVNGKVSSTNQIVQGVEALVDRIPVNSGTQPVNLPPNMVKNSAMGIASFVLGIIAICSFGLSVIPAILSIIMGIIAIKDPNAKHGLPVAGLFMSVISLVILIVLIII